MNQEKLFVLQAPKPHFLKIVHIFWFSNLKLKLPENNIQKNCKFYLSIYLSIDVLNAVKSLGGCSFSNCF